MANLNIRLTRHAREVMAERSVAFEEIVEVLARPEIIEPHQGKRRFVRGDLAIVVARGEGRVPANIVVTILFRRGDQWTSAEMAAR